MPFIVPTSTHLFATRFGEIIYHKAGRTHTVFVRIDQIVLRNLVRPSPLLFDHAVKAYRELTFCSILDKV